MISSRLVPPLFSSWSASDVATFSASYVATERYRLALDPRVRVRRLSWIILSLSIFEAERTNGSHLRFDTGGAAAPDDHECQQPFALGIISSELRLLKNGQNVATDTRSVFDALETGSELSPTIITEIRISCPRCDSQKIK